MSFELAKASFSPFASGNFERLWKFTLINVGIGMLVSVLILFIVSSFDVYVAAGITLAVVVVSQLFALSLYARFRNCHFETQPQNTVS